MTVLTSSREEERDLMESDRLGITSYIIKPVDFVQFTEAIEQIGLFWALLNHPPTV